MKQLLFVTLVALGHSLLAPCQTTDLKTQSAETALAGHRQRIDVLDKQILSLLNERAQIALEIGRIRQREGTPPSSARSRQDEVLRNAASNSAAPLSPEAARRIYERIIAEMVAIQTLDEARKPGGGSAHGRER